MPDVFLDLNITFENFVCLKTNQSIATHVYIFNLKLFRTKVDIKSVIRDYSLTNYLNAVLKSLRTRGLTYVPRQQIAEV